VSTVFNQLAKLFKTWISCVTCLSDLEARVGVAHSNQSFTSKENEKITV